MKQYFVYILASKKNGTLYIGFTNDLERRVGEHKAKVVISFTQKYDVDKLVYFETFNTSYEAFKRERQLKKWKREWKIQLVEAENMAWKDLAEDWK
ncbi:MAG: GIY-YIG nuclease family protein [Tenuifilaceae bacterium]